MTFPIWGALAVGAYVLALLGISYYRSRSADLSDYLIGGRNSAWWLLTIGLISDSVSGVTYVSVPGSVGTQAYAYLQIIFGHFFGYQIIAFVLLPLYYRRNSISIYQYLKDRFGPKTEKTGASFFVASRLFGSAARLYIATMVLHAYFFGDVISPIFSFFFALVCIVIYTLKGGIKALVWTDAFQSVFLLLGILAVVSFLFQVVPDPWGTLMAPKIFHWDPYAKNYFWKHFIGGIFITVAMNGLDQNIMQKNMSAPHLKDAQRNMSLFGFLLILVNFIFVGLGALLIEAYSAQNVALPLGATGAIAWDRLLPDFVFHHLGAVPSVFLVLGLTAATLSSVDSVLPTVASSIEIDLMNEEQRRRIPVRLIHVSAAAVIFLLIVAIYFSGATSLIDIVLKYIGYTSGPLLGMYGLGILTPIRLRDSRVPACAILAIVLTTLIDWKAPQVLHGYQIGFEIILINALLFSALATLFARDPAGLVRS